MNQEMATRALSGFTFPSDDAMLDPYWAYGRLRGECPVYRVPDAGDTFLVTRFEDMVRIAHDPDVFRQSGNDIHFTGEIIVNETVCPVGPTVSLTDAPVHEVYRALAFRAFKPARLNSYVPVIEEVGELLVSRMRDHGTADLVEEYASVFPFHVIARILGFPHDEDQIRCYTEWVTSFSSISPFVPEVERARHRARVNEMAAFLLDQIQGRIDEPGSDVLSEILRAREEQPIKLALPELVGLGMAMLIAGGETTALLIANALLLVLADEDLLRAVRDDEAARRRIIEESLRLEPPTHMNVRLCRKEVTISGVTIPAGARVILCWASGNRDSEQFADPDTLDLERANAKQHLAFGRGIHGCVGAPLARLEAALAVKIVLDQLPQRRLVGKTPERGVRKWMRPLGSLNVAFDTDPPPVQGKAVHSDR
jgi:cytochrome P450